MSLRRRKITDIVDTVEPVTGEISRAVTVVEQDDDDPVGTVYAAGLVPERGAALEPAIVRAQRAGQVQRALAFLAVRADAFGWRPGADGEPPELERLPGGAVGSGDPLWRAVPGALADPSLLAPSSPVGDDTVQCAANILRARPDASLLEQRHGRLP